MGAGDTPRFVLFAEADGMPQDLLKNYEDLLEPAVREPYHSGGLWLVAKAGDWNAVTAYLDRVAPAEAATA